MRKYVMVILLLGLVSCGGPADRASDPTERGLSYVAGAIITAAVIRAIFNK